MNPLINGLLPHRAHSIQTSNIYPPSPFLPLKNSKVVMGSCVSKCYTDSSSKNNSIDVDDDDDDDSSAVVVVVQEKLVISESPSVCKPSSTHLSNTQTSSFLSSSSLLYSASPPSVSSSSSSSTCITSAYPQASRAKQNPRIVVLDPQKQRAAELPVQIQQPTPTTLRGRPPPTRPPAITSRSFPAKRARSSSPNSAARRKSCRTASCPAAAPSNRKTNFSQQRREAAMRASVRRPPNACNPPSMEKEARVRQMHQIQNRDDEVSLSYGIPVAEDVNNPLISMDCFIFL
ncbi:hypothetical protein Cni_G26658 [Canna indica]|uniref:Uncharacterized protein n=1 Tax=Canna indica TaxID=4628 RepID=A0AAQ3QRJ0_9LILI|nr:hypothetical protein Cni_G26658 [Canna indica]